MTGSVPAEISEQLSRALDVIEGHLASALLAVHLYGSALNGGLKPCSDIDLLVTVAAMPDETARQALMLDLLKISAPPGQSKDLRALEVTIVVRNNIVPWRYPARRELQFGEWLREDILTGIVEPAVIDADLALLITQARQHSIALAGPPAAEFFEPVPESDLFSALADTLKLWKTPMDWAGDERNVVLTLARVWYSAATGKIAPKDVAAEWVVERLPDEHQSALSEARQAYLGHCEDRLALRGDQLTDLIAFIKREVTSLLGQRQ
ncbi:AadA family aminoglycoside 3''-O-nucleotidyltransferase [Aquincola agrisoli]|uniref:AadA family aminoglycoside 3''-O-nucleotidyltransferase n=1 Tax=Aquincola sp. GCM10022187 TaxID=3252634 RepID=UPI0031F3234C